MIARWTPAIGHKTLEPSFEKNVLCEAAMRRRAAIFAAIVAPWSPASWALTQDNFLVGVRSDLVAVQRAAVGPVAHRTYTLAMFSSSAPTSTEH